MLYTASPGAAEFSGKVSLSDQGKSVAAEEYADVVVYFVPAKPVSDLAPLSGPVEMHMENKTFVPRVLPVTVGTEVKFANIDPILHNAFSTSTNNAFDLGFYGGGEAHSHQFADAGLVRVYCNVHHSMVAYVLVLNTPHFTGVSASGEFTLRDLPEAVGELYVWHPRADVVRNTLDFAQAGLPKGDYKLDFTQRRIPTHLNKEGKSYRKPRERSY
ncbi:MAG: cupredoxin domain-containing protein [Gammaproteobacteria bacterium]